MKYLKSFREAVIHPPKFENDFQINSFEDLVKYGNQNNFDVVDYKDFYDSLSDIDKTTAPPRGVPFFALFHPQRKKPMFVLNNPMIATWPNFKTIVDDIIRHELIHAEQTRRRGELEFALPSPTEQKKYFSNKEEIMAFSWTIANDISKESRTLNDAIKRLDDRLFDKGQMWATITRVCDTDVIKRYRKYIYMYLNEMIPNQVENIHTKISRKKSS